MNPHQSVAAHVMASGDSFGIARSPICGDCATTSAPVSRASNCASEQASMTVRMSSRCTSVMSAQIGSFSG